MSSTYNDITHQPGESDTDGSAVLAYLRQEHEGVTPGSTPATEIERELAGQAEGRIGRALDAEVEAKRLNEGYAYYGRDEDEEYIGGILFDNLTRAPHEVRIDREESAEWQRKAREALAWSSEVPQARKAAGLPKGGAS